MSNGVEFDEDKYGLAGRVRAQQGFQAPSRSSGGNSRMSQWLIKKGLAKSGTSAQIILIVVVILNIAVTYFVIKYFL